MAIINGIEVNGVTMPPPVCATCLADAFIEAIGGPIMVCSVNRDHIADFRLADEEADRLDYNGGLLVPEPTQVADPEPDPDPEPEQAPEPVKKAVKKTAKRAAKKAGPVSSS